MDNIDLGTPLWQLTAEQFLQLQDERFSKRQYVYGIAGLAKLLGCSRSKANNIKKTGVLEDAIFQNGNVIIIDVEKALRLLNIKKDGKK